MSDIIVTLYTQKNTPNISVSCNFAFYSSLRIRTCQIPASRNGSVETVL